MPGSAVTELLASYVPRLIQKRVAENPRPIDSPLAKDFQAAVLFADISGFTALTERLAEKGTAGVETLAHILNDYFGQLIDVVYEHGGDVVKFGGDAIIVVWPTSETASDQTQDEPAAASEERQQLTLRAAECAFKIRERLLNYQAQGATLYLKFSLGTGRVWESHIGGVFNRWEFVLVGEPLIEISAANHFARAGDIIASPSAWELIREDCEAEPFRFELEPGGKTGLAARLRKLNHRAQSSIDHREKALRFGDAAQAALRPYIPGAIIHRISAGQSDWLAELRKVTILFINLPQLSHTTSLETAHETMRLIQQLVYRFEGSLNKISQDDKGVMIDAAFGLPPLAHGDDPLRGIQSALMIRHELQACGFRGAIGVTTGRVFCGLIGTDQRREYTFLGNSVNLAGRLMSLALEQKEILVKDGIAVLCDRSTYESAKDRTEFRALAPQRVKGRNEPVDVFYPVREKKEAVRARTELIGRKQEKALLVNAIQELQRGMPFQAIILHGEAGIGKSRLMDELIQQAERSHVTVLSGASDNVEKNNPYFAWRSVFNGLFGLDEFISKSQLTDEDRSQILNIVLEKLRAVDPEILRYTPLLNVVLPISIPENEFTSAMTGEVRGGNIRDLLVLLLQQAAKPSGILISIEDLHWLDSASWTLLADAYQKVRPLLLAVNTRPLSRPVPQAFKELAEHAETKFVKLDMMSLEDVEQLVCQRLGVRSVPSEAGKLIRSKSEGHPFFAEELAYALRDAGVLIVEGDQCSLAPGLHSLNSITLPDNLEAAITSRIDSLNPSQQLTLKVASVIGRIFAVRVLEAIHPIEADKPELNQYLETLTRLSLTLIESETPDLAYLFKHAVTQEVAYNLMLYSQRRQLHQAVAEWIERSYEHEIASYYALLAHHWMRAADEPEPAQRDKAIRKAVNYLEKAGDQSLNNFANTEAVQFFTDLLQFQDEVKPSRLQLGQWYHKLAMSYLGLGKLNEAKENFLTALETLGQHVPASTLGMIGGLLLELTRQTSHRLFPRIHRNRVTDPGEEAVRLEVVQILQHYATVLFLIGDPNPLPMFQSVVTGLNTAESIRDTPELAFMYAQMGAICGFIPARGQAKHYTEQWRSLNERLYNANYFVSSSIALATVESGIGAWRELQLSLEKVIEICNSLGDNRQAGESISFLASNATIEGNVLLIEQYNTRLLENAMRRNNPVQLIWYYEWAGSLAIRQEEWDKAREIVGRAFKVMERTPVGEVAEFIIHGIDAAVEWHTGNLEKALKQAKDLLDRAAKMQVVDYSVYVGFFHFMDVIFLALEHAHEQNHPQVEKDELMKYAQLALKIMKAYARVFTVGEPAVYRYQGWIDWYSGKHEKACQSWRTAGQKAHLIPMYYEEGMSLLALATHLPFESSQRTASFEKAREAFIGGGLMSLGEMVNTVRAQNMFRGQT